MSMKRLLQIPNDSKGRPLLHGRWEVSDSVSELPVSLSALLPLTPAERFSLQGTFVYSDEGILYLPTPPTYVMSDREIVSWLLHSPRFRSPGAPVWGFFLKPGLVQAAFAIRYISKRGLRHRYILIPLRNAHAYLTQLGGLYE